MKLEDTARARPYFQRVVDDYGDSVPTSQRWLLDKTKQYIADIDKR